MNRPIESPAIGDTIPARPKKRRLTAEERKLGYKTDGMTGTEAAMLVDMAMPMASPEQRERLIAQVRKAKVNLAFTHARNEL